LIFPDPDEYQRLEQNGGALMEFGRLLRSFGAQSTGSSNRIERAIVLKDLPSIDAGEITDKGSINQRAVLQRRADLVEHLYRVPRPEFVLSIDEKEG
jgi:feruloyl-CoA synthase